MSWNFFTISVTLLIAEGGFFFFWLSVMQNLKDGRKRYLEKIASEYKKTRGTNNTYVDFFEHVIEKYREVILPVETNVTPHKTIGYLLALSIIFSVLFALLDKNGLLATWERSWFFDSIFTSHILIAGILSCWLVAIYFAIKELHFIIKMFKLFDGPKK